jgi:hypothetical protein
VKEVLDSIGHAPPLCPVGMYALIEATVCALPVAASERISNPLPVISADVKQVLLLEGSPVIVVLYSNGHSRPMWVISHNQLLRCVAGRTMAVTPI